MSNKITPAELLANKLLNNTISPEQEIELNSWYSQDLDETVEVPAAYGLSEEDHRRRMLAAIQAQTGLGRSVKFWRRIAAAAAIILCSGLALYFYVHRVNNPHTDFAQSQIIPGGNKAILTLANGTKISLSDAHLGQVAAQSGVRIAKTADGTLVYDASGSTGADQGKTEYNTVEAPVGGQWQVKLPDGSVVFLNALSSVTYPTRFGGKERRVKMQGEAYFEVAHNKALPFRVESLGQTVEVLGTHFNIMAYADEKIIKTTLLEGSVKISDHGKNELLKPGQQAQVSGSGIKVTSAIDLEEVLAWKAGYFKFDDSLESIMNKVARWYNVEIVYQYKPDPNLTFAGKVSRAKNISALLKIIEFNGDVHFKIDGRRVIVMK